ncbi:MAG: hypothetical protein ACJ76P_07035 [Actinomycetota bacterium]
MANVRVGRGVSWGIARVAVLVLGVVFVAVALIEVITQDTLTPVLEYSAPLNAIHWAIGVFLLIACVAGERVSRAVVLVVGVVLAAAAVVFLFDRTAFEALLDYPYPEQHPLPGSYIVLYGVSAMAALGAALWPRRKERSEATPSTSARAAAEAS